MRHVRKHSLLWHSVGMRVAAAEISIDMTFFPRQHTSIDAIAHQLLEVIAGERTSERSLLVPHVFSNGGVLLMLSLIEAAREVRSTVTKPHTTQSKYASPFSGECASEV